MIVQPHTPGDWAKDAKCQGRNPDDYETKHLPTLPHAKSKALTQLCGGCRVFGECATAALEFEDGGYVRAGVAVPFQFSDRARFDRAMAELKTISERWKAQHGKGIRR